MTLRTANITFDCADPPRVAAFWADALGLSVDDGASEFFCSISGNGPKTGGAGFFFIKVPEAKTVKNRVHLDLSANGDREVEVERLLGLGATRVGDYQEWGHNWTTLRDVEGNEFCIA